MTEPRIDHVAEAKRLLSSAEGRHIAAAHVLAQLSTTEAMLALVEQHRLANIIALANSDHGALNEQVAADAAGALAVFRQHENPVVGGWYELSPEVAAALGIDLNGEDDA